MSSTIFWVLMTLLAIVLGIILVYVIYNFNLKRIRKGLEKVEQDRELLKQLQSKPITKLGEVNKNGGNQTDSKTSTDNIESRIRESTATSSDIDSTEPTDNDTITVTSGDGELEEQRRTVENASPERPIRNKRKLVFVKRRN